MPRTRNHRHAEEEKYIQQQLEIELVKLRRQYNVLDAERAQAQLTKVNKLGKTDRVALIFKNEYLNLLTELNVATSAANLRRDDVQFNQLSNLLNEYDLYNDELKTEKTYMAELEKQLRKTAKKVQDGNKQIPGNDVYEAYLRDQTQVVDNLENQLETQMKKFNTIVAKNIELRDHIDFLMHDRKNFMNIFQKLIDKICAGKHIMLDLIEQATLAYDQREEWCNKLQILRTTAHRDLTLNMDEMRKCHQQVDHAKQMEQFYTIKGRKRVMRDLMTKETLKRLEMKKKLEEKLKGYRDMVDEIREFCNESKTNVITSQYCRQEKINFSQFLFIINNIREMEEMNDRLGMLQMEIDEETQVQSYRRDQQKAALESLEIQLKNITEMAQASEKEFKEINAHLEELMAGVWQLFKLCKCSNDPLLKLLNNFGKIKTFNILLFLQVLESKIQECLVLACFKDHEDKKSKSRLFQDSEESNQIYTITKIVKADPCALCLSHEMVSDVTDAAQFPWNRQVAIRKLNQRLTFPESSAYIHTLSKCHLPQSRRIMQQRYE